MNLKSEKNRWSIDQWLLSNERKEALTQAEHLKSHNHSLNLLDLKLQKLSFYMDHQQGLNDLLQQWKDPWVLIHQRNHLQKLSQYMAVTQMVDLCQQQPHEPTWLLEKLYESYISKTEIPLKTLRYMPLPMSMALQFLKMCQ